LEEADTTVARGATSIYFSTVIILVMNTVYFIIIANLLSTTEIGVYAGLQLFIFGFSTLANFSLPQTIPSNLMLPQAVAKFVPEFLGRREKGKATRSFLTVLLIVLVIATILSATLYFFAEPVSQTIFRGEAETFWIELLALDTWIYAVGQLFYGGLVGLKRIPRASLFLIISFGVKFILGASLVVAGQGIFGILVAFAIGDLFFLATTAFSCIRPLWVKLEPVSTRFIIDYSAPLLVASLIIFGVTQLDKIFTFLSLDLSDLGIYNVAVTASTIGAFAPNAITTALVPSLSTLEAKQKLEEFQKLARTYTRYVVLIATPMAFGISALATGLVQLFGPQYLLGALPAAIMSVATGVTAISAVYNGALLATRRTKSIMLVNLMGVAVLAVSLMISAPLWGFVGVSLSRAVMIITIALLLVYVTRRHGLFVIDGRAYRDALLAASIMGLVLYFALEFIGGYQRQLVSLVVLVPAGMVIYLLVLRVLKTFTVDDVEFIRRLLPRQAGRLVRLLSKLAGVA
jgi:O-antigen/teichoic acid export membrane protein